MKTFLNLQFFADDADNTTETPEKAPETDKPEKTYTAAEVDKIIADRLARERAKAEKERQKADEARKFAQMNDAEKTATRMKELETKLEKLELERNLSAMRSEARKLLSEQGIHISDSMLSRLVSEDAEETKEAVTSFAAEYKKAVETEAGEKVKGYTPKPRVCRCGIYRRWQWFLPFIE